MMERWQGKVAVVTGAAGGIGGAIANTLAKAGLRVVGLDITAKEEISKVGQGTLHTLKCDVTDMEELRGIFNRIEDSYGGVDIMVNCAGCAKVGQITSVGDSPITDEDVQRIMDVNVTGMIFCSRYAVNSMKRREVDGHIVNVNSIAGHYVAFSKDFNLYSSSKYAVTAFTQSLTNELAHFKSKIKTTSVSPGLVQTELSRLSGAFVDLSATPALQPQDIADAVLYAISTPPHVNVTEITVQPVGELKQ